MKHLDENRRRMQRRHLLYYLRVFDTGTGAMLGHIVDINTGGFLLLSEAPIPVGTVYHLSMTWVDEEERKRELRFAAESVWGKHDVNPDFWDTGFRLTETTPDELQEIRAVIDDIGFGSFEAVEPPPDE